MTTQAIAIQTLLNYHTGAVRRALSNRRASMVIDEFKQIVNDSFSSAETLTALPVKKFIHISCPDDLTVTITKSTNVVMKVNGVFTMTITEDATPVTVTIANPDTVNPVKILVIYA